MKGLSKGKPSLEKMSQAGYILLLLQKQLTALSEMVFDIFFTGHIPNWLRLFRIVTCYKTSKYTNAYALNLSRAIAR